MSVWALFLFVATCAVMRVSCISNREFIELLIVNTNEDKTFDVDKPTTGDIDAGIVRLPGIADDELDIEPLLKRLDQTLKFQSELSEDVPETEKDSVVNDNDDSDVTEQSFDEDDDLSIGDLLRKLENQPTESIEEADLIDSEGDVVGDDDDDDVDNDDDDDNGDEDDDVADDDNDVADVDDDVANDDDDVNDDDDDIGDEDDNDETVPEDLGDIINELAIERLPTTLDETEGTPMDMKATSDSKSLGFWGRRGRRSRRRSSWGRSSRRRGSRRRSSRRRSSRRRSSRRRGSRRRGSRRRRSRRRGSRSRRSRRRGSRRRRKSHHSPYEHHTTTTEPTTTTEAPIIRDVKSMPLRGQGLSKRHVLSRCITQTVMFDNFDRIILPLKACANVSYVPVDESLQLTTTLNGRELFSKTISVKSPDVTCHDIPGLQSKVRFCVGVSSFDQKTETMCLRTDVTMVKQGKTTEYGANLGCIKFPKAGEQEVTKLTRQQGNQDASKMASMEIHLME